MSSRPASADVFLNPGPTSLLALAFRHIWRGDNFVLIDSKKHQKMKNYISLSLVFILFAGFSLTLSSCKTEGCTNPDALNYDPKADEDDGSCDLGQGTVMMHFHDKWGDDPFTLGNDYTLADGRVVNLNIVRFYMSQFTLLSSTGETAIPDVYHQYVPGTEMYSLGNVTPGTYTGLRFVIGVEEEANLSDPSLWPSDHALSIDNANFDHWNWNKGYVFMKVEGNVDGSTPQTGSADSSVVYHVGTQSFARTITIPTTVSLAEGGTTMYHCQVDVEAIFNGLDMAADFDTHTGDNMPLATSVADNFVTAVTAEE